MTGADIKNFRHRYRLTQIDLSNMLGFLSHSHVSARERGSRPIPRWFELAIKGLDAELKELAQHSKTP